MMERVVTPVLLSLLCGTFYAQGMRDSIYQMHEFEVKAERLFNKEEAGMKESKVDSLVLLQKSNLSLSELLSENTTVFIKSHGRGALATASFRGTAASHTQVRWNGININSPMAGMVDFSLIPVYIIDDMNLKHGTSSIADQSGGLGGSININNRVDWDEKLKLKYLQGVGSYSTYDEFLQVGGGTKKLQLNLRLYHNYSRNDYTYLNRGIASINYETGTIINPVDTNKLADYSKYGLLQEVYYRPSQESIFSAKYWGQWANRTIPRATSYEGPDNSNLNNQDDQDHKVVIDWKRYSDNSTLTLRSGYAQKNLDYSLKNYVPGVGLLPAVYSLSKQYSSLNSAVYRYQLNDKFSLESSLDFNFHDVASRDSVTKESYAQERKEISSFLALRKNVANKVNINLMLRQDWVDDSFVPFVPFLGFDYRVWDDMDFLIKGNIARNYHQPSLNDLYWQPGGNASLLPEEGNSAELGLEYQGMVGTHVFKSELTLYRSDIDNWIIWIPSYKGYWEPRNIKRVLSQGVESTFTWHGSLSHLRYKFTVNYAYTRSINYGDPLVWGDNSYGKQLVYVPLHSGNVLCYLNYKGYTLSFQHNSYSERFTTSSNDVSQRDWLYPYFMNDLSIGKAFRVKNMDLSAELKIYNLLNETYHSILYRPMPRRNYSLLFIVAL